MIAPEITAIAGLAKSIITRIWPDPAQQAEQLHLLAELEQRGDLAKLQAHTDLLLAQLEINKAEAQHPSVWVAGARPACIWVGAASMGWAGLAHPLLLWIWSFAGIAGEPPPMIDGSAMGVILSGLLGIAGMRSYDKGQGTQTDRISR